MKTATRIAAFLIGGFILSGCEDSNPTSPGSNTCRTFATASTTTSAVQGVHASTLTMTQGAYDRTQNQFTANMAFSDTSGCSFTGTIVNTWGSVDDFVDEVSVIPGRQLLRTSTLTTSGNAACPSSAVTTTYTHDAQKRLTQFVVNGLTYTYTAWDGSGRPLTGVISTGTTEAWSYDNAMRRATLIQTSPGLQTTTVYLYDANGNSLGYTVTSGLTTSSATTATTQTSQVCK